MSDKLPPKILILESDEIARTTLSNAIERYWFTVLRAANIESASRVATVSRPNVVVISSKNQSFSLIEAGLKIREAKGCSDIPMIFIMNDGEHQEHYKTIDNDFVECVPRPFTPNEVLIAVKSLLRRSRPVFQDKVIKYKDVSMDLATFKVMRGAKRIHLGPTEFKILELLVQSPKVIFSRNQIIDYVWGADQDIESRTVDVHVNRLRSLVKLHPDELPFIKTVRSAGYCLNLPGEIA